MPTEIRKPLSAIAVLLMTRAARTEAGRKVQAHVLARVEIALWIEQELSK